MATRSSQASDNFPGVALSGNYTVMNITTGGIAFGFNVATNKATGQNPSADNFAFRNSESYTTDQYSQCKIESVTAGVNYIQNIVQARGQKTDGGGDQRYFYAIWTDGGSDGEIWKKIAGTETDIQAVTSGLPTTGDNCSIELVGDTLTFFSNTTAIGSPQSMGSSLTTGTPGIGDNSSAIQSTADFGNMVSSVTSTFPEPALPSFAPLLLM